MTIMRHIILCLLGLAFATAGASAQTSLLSAENTADSLAVVTETPDTLYVIHRKRSLIDKIIEYLDDTNKEHPDRKVDFSFLGGPSYSSSTSLNVAVIAAGLYHGGPKETTPQSEMSVYAQGSIKGMYRVGIRGRHVFRNDKFRIVYDANFCHLPSKYWGIGYANGANKANESDYTLLESGVLAEFQWHLPHNIYIGPVLDFYYAKATEMQKPELWDGLKLRSLNYGAGFMFSIDTRDFPTNATTGVNVGIRQLFYPPMFGNRNLFSVTELTAAWYHRFWQSGVCAFQIHGAAATEHTPWVLLPSLNATDAMRGYYTDRYRDKGEIDFVAEIRQHIYRRNSIVVWGGVGSVFSRISQINWHTLLPSYGIGYRWEFKKRVNVRADVGFGKRSFEFTLGLNESF